MSFKEITALRKAGKLEEALTLAEDCIQKKPDDEWIKKATAWVYYDFMKKALDDGNPGEIISLIQKIKNLNLSDNDKMVFDSIAWIVGKYLFANLETGEEILDNFFENIKEVPFSKPAASYSFLLKSFNKHAARWNNFVRFTRWWGLENFMPEDFQVFTTENGKKLPATVESIYISISKKLLAEPIDKEKIKNFIPSIEKIVREQTQLQYPPYYYAKLLLATGDKENFLQAFLPFARKKQRDFWVWDLMSEAFDQDSNEYFSCLCKSLSCGAPGKFTINVKEKLAAVFEKQNRLPEAKREYLDILETRKREGWGWNDKHYDWQRKLWWHDTTPVNHNFDIYNNNKAVSETLLFADKPETVIVVDTVNKQKKVLSFIASKTLYGFIHYGKMNILPKQGDILAARFMEQTTENKSNFHKVYTLTQTDKEPSPEICRTVTGNLSVKPPNTFGFVKEVFVSPQLIAENRLQPGAKLTVAAILSKNRKNNSWGWKAVKIKII